MKEDIDIKNNKPFTRLPNEIFNKILISDFGCDCLMVVTIGAIVL